MRYRHKRIFLNTKKTKYCVVRLYADLHEMQDDYKKEVPYDVSDLRQIWGAHHGFTTLAVLKNGKTRMLGKTGIIFLCTKHSGAGVVCHELAHAVLWAWKHTRKKKSYPIIISNIEDEEDILYNLTHAIMQFYNWFWKVTEGVTKVEQKLVSCMKSKPTVMATKTAKKSTAKKATVKRATSTDAAAIKNEQKAVAKFAGQQKSLMKKYPNLTENDFHQYEGETLDSVQKRVAERAGVPVEELKG